MRLTDNFYILFTHGLITGYLCVGSAPTSGNAGGVSKYDPGCWCHRYIWQVLCPFYLPEFN